MKAEDAHEPVVIMGVTMTDPTRCANIILRVDRERMTGLDGGIPIGNIYHTTQPQPP